MPRRSTRQCVRIIDGVTWSAGVVGAARPAVSSARRAQGLGRLVLVAALVIWAAGAIAVALREFLSAGHNAAVMAAVIRSNPDPTGTLVVTGMQPDEPLWLLFSRTALVLGVVGIGAVWLTAFAGRGFRRGSSALVVVLFAMMVLATWLSVLPETHHWWAGRALGSSAALDDWMTYDRQAAALFMTVSALAALGLSLIAVKRPGRDRLIEGAPPGWYLEGEGLRYWNGASWTEHRLSALEQ